MRRRRPSGPTSPNEFPGLRSFARDRKLAGDLDARQDLDAEWSKERGMDDERSRDRTVSERAAISRDAIRRVVLFAAPLFLSVPAGAGAQALPFHTATGITAGFQENAGRSFVNFLGRGGLVREGEKIPDPMERDIDAFAVVAGVIPFSVTPQWTFRAAVPFVAKSMDFNGPDGRRLSFDASGIGDALIDTKWIFYSDNRPQASTRLGLQAGVKVPLGETDSKLPDGSVAPRPLQVGTGSWDFPVELVFSDIEGRWGFLANTGWRFNTEDEGFEAGDVFSYDAAVGFRFVPWTYESLTDQTVVAYLELNGEAARRDEIGGMKNPDSGGHVLFLSPDLQWIPTPWLLFEGSVQVPVVQDLNGTQLEHDVRFQLGTRFRFSAFR